MNLNNNKAAIFDMDGVLVVNMHFHELAFYEFGKRHGIEITREFFIERICGNTNQRIMSILFDDLSEAYNQRFSDEKEAIYRELYVPHLKPANGLLVFLQSLHAQNIPMAIASNAPKENIDFIIEALNLGKYFSVQLHVNSVANPKPAPDMFLRAAHMLDVAPGNCVVFEDAPGGIRAAKVAGMKAVALLTTHTKEEFADVDLFVGDFDGLLFDVI